MAGVAPEHNDVVVLNYGLWHGRFGGNPSIIGQSLTLSGTPSTVVGVMPEDFYFPNRATELWRPIALPASGAGRGGHYLGTIARLKPGVSLIACANVANLLLVRASRSAAC
jgi:putative ABC transport system permease protein